jgi:glycosyltransferase involved in cell wall biosynthesis
MPGKLSPRIAVVIPCYNTGRACIDVITRARAAGAVLVVDDGSTDDTPEHIRSTGVPCLRLPVNAGKGAALKAGIEEALKGRQGLLGDAFDYVVTVDGDGQHDPSDISRFVTVAVRDAADLVIGVRDVRAMPRKSRIGNDFARLFFFLGTGRFVPDTQCGFRLHSRALAEALLPSVSWRRYETEAAVLTKAVSLGYTVGTVVIPTVYFDENRRTHFDPQRDSMRVIAVLSRDALSTLAVTAVDVCAFVLLLPAFSANVIGSNVMARVGAVLAHIALSRGDVFCVRGRFSVAGLIRYGAVVAVSLTLTTWLLLVFQSWGASPLSGKILAHLSALAAFLVTFIALDRIVHPGVLRNFLASYTPRSGT